MDAIYSVESFENGEGKFNRINSPRTLEACMRLGYDPSELQPKDKKQLKKEEPTLTGEMLDIKYEQLEYKRCIKIDAVKKERNAMIASSVRKLICLNTAGAKSVKELKEEKEKNTMSAALEMEVKRMEALRKRQEDELAKIFEREQVMVALQAKIKKTEEDEFARKKLHEKKIAAKKIEDMKKAAARKAEEKRLLEEEASRKREIDKKEAAMASKVLIMKQAEDKRLEKEAALREEERRKRIEEGKRKTEALIQSQFDKAEENRKEMIEREIRVRTQLREKKRKKAQEVLEAREKANKRIATTIEQSKQIQEKKKEDFDERSRLAEERAKVLHAQMLEKAKKEADEREKAEKIRIQRLVDSYNQRNSYRQELINSFNCKEEIFTKLKADQDYKMAMNKFHTDLKIQDKLDNVERQARKNEFQRLTWLKKIESGDRKYEIIQGAKKKLDLQHEIEKKSSLIRKHEISDTMEKMRQTNDFTLLDKLFAKKATKDNKSKRKEEDDKEETPPAP
jgi:hypothetical protein